MTGMSHVAPESFVSVCQVLYGGLVDADAIWEDVAKRSPDQADVHVPTAAQAQQRDRRTRQITAGLSAVGAAAGTAGLGYAGYKTGQAYRATPKTLSRPRRLARAASHEKLGAALIPLEVAGLGGELMATHILHGDTKKKTLVPTGRVNKAFRMPSINMANLPKLDDVIAGSRKAMRSIVDSTTTTGPKPRTPAGNAEIKTRLDNRADVQAGHPRNQAAAEGRARGQKRWGDAAYHTTKFLGTTSGKVAAGGAAAVGTGAVVHERNKLRANAVYIDPYDSTTLGKSYDFEAVGEISKIDMDKHLVFGWISVSKINGAPVVDRQNDYIDPADLEEAAYAYVHGSRVGGDMHGRGIDDTPRKVSDLVESVVFTPEKIAKMGLPADFPIGWWGGFKVHDEQAWDDVKKGKRTGFSVHGKGRRTEVDLDELMGA